MAQPFQQLQQLSVMAGAEDERQPQQESVLGDTSLRRQHDQLGQGQMPDAAPVEAGHRRSLIGEQIDPVQVQESRQWSPHSVNIYQAVRNKF